jgi:chemotaxis signal transduction protein
MERAPDADPAGVGLAFALFGLGTLQVAVPADNVVQAIALPAQLTRLPRAGNALEGVFLHRGQVVPLLDLQHWLAPDTARPDATGRQVLVLRAAEQWVAIRIDTLKGLLRLPVQAVRRVHHDDDAREVFHSVLQAPGTAGLISLLDPARLALLAQVWAAGAAPSGAALQARDAAQARTPTARCVVVRLGATLLALPATAVGEVVGGAVVQKMAGLASGFLGMGRWRGRDLPVLDMARLLNLPQASDGTPWLLVLQQEARVLGFPVSEILAVRSFDAAALQRGAALSDAMQAYCQGSWLTPQGERVWLLDAPALLDASPLSNLRPTAQAQDALRLGYQNRASAGALVVFRSRQLWATSMDRMREVLRLPQQPLAAPDVASPLRGAMEWRGQALPLLDLRLLRDAQPSALGAEARVIVTQSGAHPVGLLVESVVALIPGHSGTRSRFRANGSEVEMVSVGSGAEQLSYQLTDLGPWAQWPGHSMGHAV